MNRISLIVHVDPFADDELYEKLADALLDIGSQIYSEPVVDRVVLSKGEDIDD